MCVYNICVRILYACYSAADNKYGDPLMTFVPGIVHYDSIYTVTCIPVRGSRGYFDHYISVIIPSDRITGLQVKTLIHHIGDNH